MTAVTDISCLCYAWNRFGFGGNWWSTLCISVGSWFQISIPAARQNSQAATKGQHLMWLCYWLVYVTVGCDIRGKSTSMNLFYKLVANY